MEKSDFLDHVKDTVTGPREKSYGKPAQNLTDIADLWSVFLDTEVTPHDVAVMMMLVKIARLKASPEHFDSLVDIAGYTACHVELSHDETHT